MTTADADTMLAVLAVHQIAAIAGNQRVCNLIIQYAYLGDYHMQCARDWALYFAPVLRTIRAAESRVTSYSNENAASLTFKLLWYHDETINIRCIYCWLCGEYSCCLRPIHYVAKIECDCSVEWVYDRVKSMPEHCRVFRDNN